MIPFIEHSLSDTVMKVENRLVIARVQRGVKAGGKGHRYKQGI